MSQDKKNTFQPPRGFGDHKDQLLASASWQVLSSPYCKGSIYLGRNGKGEAVGVNDDRHLFTAAGNRAGKGTSLIIPNLYGARWLNARCAF